VGSSEALVADNTQTQSGFDGDDLWWAIAAKQTKTVQAQPCRSIERPAQQQPMRATRAAVDAPRIGRFVPVAPVSLADTGLSLAQIESLVLKYLLNCGTATGRDISDQLRLPFPQIREMLMRLKTEQLVVYRGSAQLNDYDHQLTDLGCERARRYSEQCTYFGAAPVPLSEYCESVRQQSLRRETPKADRLRKALGDLVISKEIFSQIGQSVCSGHAMFLYGSPGNGKTSLAERITRAFGPHIWIPRALCVFGEIVRVFDPSVHETAPLPPEEAKQLNVDNRWVRIKRPTIIVGGELTREHLEFSSSGSTGIVEAPLHMKSNGGTLVIDDFGRQRIAPGELLNRWIVPLEKHHDYLNMPSGKKIQIPFDQLLVFATNLEPKELVDEAFLRRIPYKIEVPNPSEDEFRELFSIMSPKLGVEYREGPVNYLIEKHYREGKRPFRYCHPRDLIAQTRNFCEFHDLQPALSNEAFDAAVKNYFAVL